MSKSSVDQVHAAFEDIERAVSLIGGQVAALEHLSAELDDAKASYQGQCRNTLAFHDENKNLRERIATLEAENRHLKAVNAEQANNFQLATEEIAELRQQKAALVVDEKLFSMVQWGNTADGDGAP